MDNFGAVPVLYATGNGKETVVSLSEQMVLNVFAHTEETKRKRQRNWQATWNL